MFQNEVLFPPNRRNKDMRGIAIDVDALFLDNTFADPICDFPSREEAYTCVKDIVRTHQEYRVFVFTYYLGKEEVLVNLARDF